MTALLFLICLAASVIGGICGIGGGVIIKPTLDAMNLMSVSAISFLSGLTVLSMSVVNVFRSRKTHLVELRIGSYLAVGAVIGGILGNVLFQSIKNSAGNDYLVGMLQAIVLGIVTLLTLIYSLRLRERFPSYHVTNPIGCLSIGAGMGLISAFLGIGGGPINLAVLFIAFSMETKKAAANSLYIIMFSQLASLVTSLTKSSVPDFPPIYLIAMVSAGISGGLIGCRLNKRISSELTDKLFAGLLCVIILICIYNVVRFADMC